MKQTITINIDVRDGYELKYNPETRTIEEVKKEPVRSKSWEEFCENHPKTEEEYYIGATGKVFRLGGRCDRSSCPNHLATKEDAEGILALIQLTRLHDEWVGDWDILNSELHNDCWYSIKNIPTNHTFSLTVLQRYSDLRLLSFPTKEMAEEFLGCFKDLIDKAKKFI